jgi:hypothetical protein
LIFLLQFLYACLQQTDFLFINDLDISHLGFEDTDGLPFNLLGTLGFVWSHSLGRGYTLAGFGH